MKIFTRSIIQDKATNAIFWCECEYYEDFVFGSDKFNGLKRYARIKEWKQISSVTPEMIESVTENCKYCKHDGKDCTETKPLCSHNCWGEVEVFDAFERK